MSAAWTAVRAGLSLDDLPTALAAAVEDGTLTEPEDIRAGVVHAWVSVNFPSLRLDQITWSDLFSKAVGDDPDSYLHDGQVRSRADLPEKITLWRGAAEEFQDGMSWTDNRDRAEWFAKHSTRGRPPGKVWVATFWSDMILARFETMRGGEAEWVIDSYGEALIEEATP